MLIVFTDVFPVSNQLVSSLLVFILSDKLVVVIVIEQHSIAVSFQT